MRRRFSGQTTTNSVRGLTVRLARAGARVVIGSRDPGRAEEAAERVRAQVPEADVEGLKNADAARRGPIVLLCVPFRAQSENLTNLKPALEPGQILVDATVPLAAAVSGRATRLLDVPGAGELVVIANTGDDAELYGVHVSPDPDLVSYWLADVIDERGWGIAGDTWEVMDALHAAGQPAWFRLGDRDLAMCLLRTQ